MPTLLRLVVEVYGEYLGEEPELDFTALDRFHPASHVAAAVLNSAREVGTLLGFPRRTWQFSTSADQSSQVFVPPVEVDPVMVWRVSRVLSASYNGMSVPMGSTGDVAHHLQHAASSFPRFWRWDERQSGVVGQPQFLWAPASSGVGEWLVEVVADEIPAPAFAVGMEVAPPGVLTDSGDWLQHNSAGLSLENTVLWNGLHQEWAHLVVWSALRRLYLKENNAERAGVYGAMYHSGLQQFAESLGVRVPGAVQEGAA